MMLLRLPRWPCWLSVAFALAGCSLNHTLRPQGPRYTDNGQVRVSLKSIRASGEMSGVDVTVRVENHSPLPIHVEPTRMRLLVDALDFPADIPGPLVEVRLTDVLTNLVLQAMAHTVNTIAAAVDEALKDIDPGGARSYTVHFNEVPRALVAGAPEPPQPVAPLPPPVPPDRAPDPERPGIDQTTSVELHREDPGTPKYPPAKYQTFPVSITVRTPFVAEPPRPPEPPSLFRLDVEPALAPTAAIPPLALNVPTLGNQGFAPPSRHGLVLGGRFGGGTVWQSGKAGFGAIPGFDLEVFGGPQWRGVGPMAVVSFGEPLMIGADLRATVVNRDKLHVATYGGYGWYEFLLEGTDKFTPQGHGVRAGFEINHPLAEGKPIFGRRASLGGIGGYFHAGAIFLQNGPAVHFQIGLNAGFF
jgi:hypothetical protein